MTVVQPPVSQRDMVLASLLATQPTAPVVGVVWPTSTGKQAKT